MEDSQENLQHNKVKGERSIYRLYYREKNISEKVGNMKRMRKQYEYIQGVESSLKRQLMRKWMFLLLVKKALNIQLPPPPPCLMPVNKNRLQSQFLRQCVGFL